eukprot:scaffold2474_cov76-Skeletonema_dohrnii-CCMP3373.AAC.2
MMMGPPQQKKSSMCIWKISLFLLIVLPTPSSSVADATKQAFPLSGSAAAFQHHHYRCDTTRIRRRGALKGWVTTNLLDGGDSSRDSSVCTSRAQNVIGVHHGHHQTRRRRIRPSSTCLFLSQDDDDGTQETNDQDDGRGGPDGKDSSTSKKSTDDNLDNDDDTKSNKPQQKNKQGNNNAKSSSSNNILQMINPYNAGKQLRSTVESAIDLASAIASTKENMASRLPPDRRSIYYNYYVDDQLGLSSLELKDDALSTSTSSSSTAVTKSTTSSKSPSKPAVPTTTSSWLEEQDKDYRPEVLIIGATGKLGRVLVKRLILENNVRVRVLVRDLYSNTLNKLGVGVTYCQGDLSNMESLEYAVTDVDKIIFCAGNDNRRENEDEEEEGWDKLESILDQRKQQAELVDGIGLRNLLHAYLNVRHSDYGPSQAAKRTLFKFRKRPADFGLFGIDDGSIDGGDTRKDDAASGEAESVATSLSQCEWTKNKFGHGVFTGKVDRYGEAALASARLRSRNDPDLGIDLSVGGFAGLVCRICSDGGVYEAFVRTEAFERLGVEYVCEFKTASKTPTSGSENRSRDKFSTVRLEFKDFLPRMRPQFQTKEDEEDSREALGKSGNIPKFVGKDIRQLGFRFRGQSNPLSWSSGFG